MPDIQQQPTALSPAAPTKKADEAKNPADIGKGNKNKPGKERHSTNEISTVPRCRLLQWGRDRNLEVRSARFTCCAIPLTCLKTRPALRPVGAVCCRRLVRERRRGSVSVRRLDDKAGLSENCVTDFCGVLPNGKKRRLAEQTVASLSVQSLD
jgi:hypothetical protein